MVHHILKQRGFSLVELAIVLSVIAIMSAAVMPLIARSVEIKAGEKTVQEVMIIQDAARKFWYDTKTWPSSLTQMQSAGYLSPLWSLNNPWNHPYVISATVKTFVVSTDVPSTVTGLLTARLPLASLSGTTVASAVGAGDSNLIAAGLIVAWSGTIADIPAGWQMCDGTNGTPDLRDKFIVGARQDDAGEAKTAITGALSQSGGTVSHDHGGQTQSHTLTVNEIPPHAHGYYKPVIGGRYDGHSSPLVTNFEWAKSELVGGGQGHAHGIAADQHVPPYYALAFIMKLP